MGIKNEESAMTTEHSHYAARLEIDHPEKLDKFSSFFRLLFGIPIAFLLGALTYSEYVIHDSSKTGFDVQSASSTAGCTCECHGAHDYFSRALPPLVV